jgi:hypothetical protein
MRKGLNMAPQKRLLALRRKGHHKKLVRIAQPHDEQLHHHRIPLQHDRRLTPVHLRIDPRVKDQRQIERRPPHRLTPPAHIGAHRRFRPLIACLTQRTIDLPACITLLAQQTLILHQHRLDLLLVRTQHRRIFRLAQLIRLRF